MKQFIFLSLTAFFLFTVIVEAETRPNIIFVLVDDLRWDALSCMGHPVATTPNIDRIAKEGALFENFFVSIPLCSPSRSSFLTGQYAHKTGVIDNTDHSALSHRLVTFPKLLHDGGYESAYIGKWHMGKDSSKRPGFDYWVCLPGQGQYENPMLNVNGVNGRVTGYVTDILNEHAQTFIKKEHKKPFVLCLSHKAVHGPFTPAERHKNLFEDPKFPSPPSLHDNLKGKPVLMRSVPNNGVPKKKKLASDSENDGNPTGKFPAKLARSQMQDMASVDDGVGAIFKALEETKQLENTVIIFSSDNGYFWGEHGLGDKRWAYEEAIRDPLLVRYPKLVKAGSKIAPMVLNIDLAPTILQLGGVAIPKEIQGRSFLPLLTDKKAKWRDSAFFEYFKENNYSRTPTWQAIRTEDWKYIQYTELDGMDELYNLKADPFEMKNLIDEPASKKQLVELKKKLSELKKTL